MAVFIIDGICPACGMHSDKLGDHAIACGGKGEQIARQNQLRNVFYQTAVQAALAPTKEERALIPGREDRPTDILIPNWTGGQDTVCDVTVISPLQKDCVRAAAEDTGSVLHHTYTRKMNSSFESCKQQGIHFIPLPFETLGGLHKSTVDTVTRLARHLARNTGCEQLETSRHLFQRLSVLLMKGNTALLLNRTPTFAPQEVDGDIDIDI